MRLWSRRLSALGCPLLVIGDKKGPSKYPLPGAELVAFGPQLRLPFRLARLLPAGHYVRKNLGYLLAMQHGAECIYETDDDNAPSKAWQLRNLHVPAVVQNSKGWVNVYQRYSEQIVWPRGMPLNTIHCRPKMAKGPAVMLEAPIQQGLANGSPDVDAIWRLVLDDPIEFNAGPALALPSQAWCPFNSQSTWWWPQAYRLMYLPSYCTFRMTDIWRSLVAQRCLWAWGRKLVFHSAEVVQARNQHDLMRDFEDEIPGYLSNDKIRRTLEALQLNSGPSRVGDNLLYCYKALVREGIFPKEELVLLSAWIEDTANILSL
jgi:hypothetical protein